MSNQNGGEIFNAYQTWMASGACPKQFLMPGTKLLDKRYEALLDSFIETKCGGLYNSTNLGLASVFLLLDSEWKAKFAQQEHQFKRELADREWQKRLKEVNDWVQSHPNCKQDDEALAVIREFFTSHPNASIKDWDEFTQAIPNDSRLWKKPTPLVLNVRNKTQAELLEMRRIYGTAPVDAALKELEDAIKRGRQFETWRETPQEVAERHTREAAEAKERDEVKQKKLDEKARVEAESIVSRFQGQTHAESFRVREQLQNILVYKPNSSTVDWQSTAETRRAAVAQYQGKNPAVINHTAR